MSNTDKNTNEVNARNPLSEILSLLGKDLVSPKDPNTDAQVIAELRSQLKFASNMVEALTELAKNLKDVLIISREIRNYYEEEGFSNSEEKDEVKRLMKSLKDCIEKVSITTCM